MDLVFIADFGVDMRRLLRVDLPAQAHVHGHPHLLARQGRDHLGLVSRERVLLLPRGVALHRRPRGHYTDAGEEGRLVYRAESVPHADLAWVDHDQRGAEHEESSDDHGAEAQQAQTRARALRPDRRGPEPQEERKREQHETEEHLAHGNSL